MTKGFWGMGGLGNHMLWTTGNQEDNAIMKTDFVEHFVSCRVEDKTFKKIINQTKRHIDRECGLLHIF